MKQLYTALLLLLCFLSFAQENEKTHGIYYKISLAGTLTINEDYQINSDDDGGSFIVPRALFINNTLGYQFDRRSNLGINFELDLYPDRPFNFFPIFFDFTYNILDFDDLVFIRGGYGKLVDLGKGFESGTTYKVGLGYRAFDENFRNSWLIGVDFNRKRFGFRQTEKLTSVSVFVEFMLF